MKFTPIILLSGILSFSSAALAAEVPSFKKADANADTFIDESEFAGAKAAGVKQTYAKLDKDKDGKLSKKEYSVLLDEDCE